MGLNMKRWLPLFAWIVLIFGLSSIPGLTSTRVPMVPGTDKMVHFAEYAVFAMLFYRGLSYGGLRVRWSLVIVVLISGIAVAALDEMYQSYIPRRDSSIYDLATDAAGIVAGTLTAVLRHISQIRGSIAGDRGSL